MHAWLRCDAMMISEMVFESNPPLISDIYLALLIRNITISGDSLQL